VPSARGLTRVLCRGVAKSRTKRKSKRKSKKTVRRHIDGTPCNEGTRSVPRGFRPCCPAFEAHVATCEFDLRYEWWAGQQMWVVALAASAGGGGIAIAFCPHCGRELAPERAK